MAQGLSQILFTQATTGSEKARFEFLMRKWRRSLLNDKVLDVSLAQKKLFVNGWLREFEEIFRNESAKINILSGYSGFISASGPLGVVTDTDIFLDNYRQTLTALTGKDLVKAKSLRNGMALRFKRFGVDSFYDQFDTFDKEARALGLTQRERVDGFLNTVGRDVTTIWTKNPGTNRVMKWKPDNYARMYSNTRGSQMRDDIFEDQLIAVGSDIVQVSNHGTTTPICQQYEGKVFSLTGNTPGLPVLQQRPPFHPNCFSKNTQVMTKEGWKYFYDVDIDTDEIYSLNLENKHPEWVKAVKFIEDKRDKLIEFKSNNMFIQVTPDHKMLFMSEWESKNKKQAFQLIQAKELYVKKRGIIYASNEWDIDLDDGTTKAEFYGYYMSEGHVYQSSSNSYQIVVSQDKKKNYDKYMKMKSCLEKMFPDNKVITMDTRLVVYNELGRHLKGFGKSYEKRIPEYIMNGSKNEIQAFLDAYLLGDGHLKKGKIFNGYLFKPSRSYFTSSPVMAAQLCQLIMKIGKRPSFKIQPARRCKFCNGEYDCREMYIIRECNSQNHSMQNIKRKYINYNDYVFCLELEKNHTMLVKDDRYSGVLWSGNCKHVLLSRPKMSTRDAKKTNFFQNKDLKKQKAEWPKGAQSTITKQEAYNLENRPPKAGLR